MPKIELRIAEPIAWLLSKPKRIKIVVGGRGSAKSTGVGDIMLMCIDQGERVCCAREFQNSIEESVHELLKQEIGRLGIEGLYPTDTSITSANGGKGFYKGLARNITSLKSLAGVNKLWIEEGESVSEKSLKVITPSIRSSASSNEEQEGDPPEIWITMNRGSSEDAVAKKYLSRADAELKRSGYYEDDIMMAVEVNWRDNPWFPPELEQERQDDFENLPRAQYDHIWEGEYNDTVDNAIILPEWFDAAIDAHKKLGFKPRGPKIVTHDPSDSGDPRALAMRQGSVLLDIQENEHDDVNDACDWALDYAIENNADLFVWDCVGIGLSLKRQVATSLSGRKIDYQMFIGSEGPDNPDDEYQPIELREDGTKKRMIGDMVKNKRSQFYLMLRDRFWATYRAVVKGEYIDPDKLISISSDIPEKTRAKLRSEVCRIPKKPNGNGLFQVMSKEEMRKLGIASPNMSDCASMSLVTPVVKKKSKPLKYNTRYVV